MPTSSRLTTNPGRGPLRVSTAAVTLTDESGTLRTVLVNTMRHLDRDRDGGTWITFIDRSQARFLEEPNEVLRRIDEVDSAAGAMPAHNHGKPVPAHHQGWRE